MEVGGEDRLDNAIGTRDIETSTEATANSVKPAVLEMPTEYCPTIVEPTAITM
tara:strand:- start:10514 stop:10672 length:159 start_codon:yes stop_codon:yes gene_type:complete